VTQVASALNSPFLPTRKLVLDLLTFLTYWKDGEGQPLVVSALEALSAANNESEGCYSYWFKEFRNALLGRGILGSLVGASQEVRKAGGPDTSLNDYAVRRSLPSLSPILTSTLGGELGADQWHLEFCG
jgi:cytokinesis protein